MKKILILLSLNLLIGLFSSVKAQSFQQSTPEAEGIASSAILKLIDRAENEIDALHSIMIVRNSKVITQGWWSPY